ncbi:hypothetical protein [Roseburia intestinalis]|uniref:hypothetical protein n=1 Tax=Roseburia intestinalis TaxID=166486 RepID=UPI00156D71A1|nr:hypothetical protein [Roseburia intestinalis]NSC32890.1 hypothetical protein [Roseburia intestinalis]
MAIKPILFNAEMVRAILDGRKTCTRRICKDANECTVPDMEFYNADRRTYAVHNFADKEHTEQLSIAERTCPICPGDILYVRETWKKAPNGYYYYEDWQRNDIADVTKWKPSIHMPKEAARIWLKVTDVRVERLQEITEVQAQAEGCNSGLLTGACTARGQFEDLWNSTVKKSDIDRYGWDANSYVWVIEFERCEKPEIES